MKKTLLLIIAITVLQPFTSFAQTQVYDLFAADLINVSGCGTIKYKSPGGGDWGFRWTSTENRKPTSVTVELNYAVNCASVPNNGTVRLNGVNQGSQPTPGPYYCQCNPGGSSPTTWTLNPADYNVVGLNTVLLNAISSAEGINVISAYANAYARVTVNYGPTVATPEIDIEGLATSIPNGDITPIVGNDTEYGTVAESTTLDHTFTIQNEAVNDLTLTATPHVTISGSDAFSIQEQPGLGTIVSGASVPFVIRFAPTCTTIGTQVAVVSVESDDPDESTYTFTVQGTGYSDLPKAITHDITVQLDATGNATIAAADIDNGSTYSCGTPSLSLDRTTFSCADIGTVSRAQAIEFTNLGAVSQETYSHGAGYNPNTNEFWYPEWNGATIYTHDSSHNLIGNFTAPVSQIMQLWMDKSSSDYYTANWGDNTINRIDGSSVVWSYDLGATASSVTANDLYVFAMSNATNTIVVLDKSTGAYVKDIALPGVFETYGGLVYANGIIYISGYDDNGITTVPSTMNAIHSFDASTGAYMSSIATAQTCYNTAFDGETIWISANSSTIDGYKVSEGNAYENGELGNIVKLTVTDAAGNIAKRTARVIVKDTMVPVITSNGDINADVDSGVCGATVIVSALAADNCSVGTPIGVRSDGKLLTDLYPTGTTTIAWNVTDTNGNAAVEATQTVIVTDNEVPVITADGDKNVNLDLGLCGATAVVSASAADNCTVGTPTGVRSDGKLLSDLYPAGTTTIAWNVIDINGNAAVEVTQTVIVSDNEVPVITADGDKNVNVDSGVCGANVIVSASATDNCSVGTPTGVRSDGKLLSDLYPTGTTTIAWNVNDANGNAAVEATQTVTVIDNILPTALTQDITVQLGTIGTASITLAQIDNGSSDSCGIATLALDKTSFSCANVGNNTVTLTVTDSSGNASTATAIVTVQDVTPPTVLTKNITVQLGVTGAVSIIASQIDNGSSDNCGIASRMVSPDSFTCDNVGDNTVTLTVTDNSGNVTTSSAIVKVNNSFTANTITRNLDTLSADETSATTYQWMTCNGGIYANLTGETNQSYTAIVVGSYSVEVTKNGCTQRSTCFDISTLGNKDFDFNSKLSVYPNPFNDVISISLDSSAKMEIYDILGQTIYSKKINSGTTSLNLSNNANGMYLMKITTENNQSKTLKILKE